MTNGIGIDVQAPSTQIQMEKQWQVRAKVITTPVNS